jgi:hypothetical protein
MSRKISEIIAIGSCVLVFLFILANGTGAQDNPELNSMKAILDCSCECRLTLAYCEKEDADCSVRPNLLTNLKGLFNEGKRGMELIRAFIGPMHRVKEQLMEARLQGRHAILFFYEEGSQACDKAKAVLKKGSQIWGDRVRVSQVDINKKENSKIRQEFRIFSSPTILVIAPNGVVVREFRENLTIQRLEGAFVSPAVAQILRGLQDRRVIFLPVAAPDWKDASSVKKTVSRVGEILRTSVRIVHVDPTKRDEESLLKTLKVDKDEDQSLTYVVSQSGQIGSRFRGPVSRKDLFMAFQKVLAARSGCGGSGSGPGGSTCK